MDAHEGRLVDHELLAAAQHGDQAAFVDLIAARSNRLFAIAQAESDDSWTPS